MKKINALKKNTGLSLLEMVVVMAILVILGTATAVWTLRSIIPNVRLNIAVRDLKSDMHAARMAAIRKSTYAVTEFYTDNSYATYVDDGGGDHAKANNYRQDENEKTIKVRRVHPHVRIFSAKFGDVPGMFAFNSRGAVDGLAGGIYLHNRLKRYRGVTISRIGKITIKASNNGSDWFRLH